MTEPAGANAQSSNLSLTWSFTHGPGKAYSLHYRIDNRAKTDAYVFDRLWRLDNGSSFVVDPEGVYRFVGGASLLFLLGRAPFRHPSLYRNVPHATHVLPGRSYERTVLVAEPVTEYNSYYLAPDPKDLESVHVGRIVLMVEYVMASTGLDVSPAPEDPTAFNLRNAGPIEKMTSESTASLDVLRRTDDFDRINPPSP
jgi:hypothetical protein